MTEKSSNATKTKRYNKNFLSQVIFKLNFAASESIDESSLKSFKSKLGDDFSTLSNIVQQGIVIQGDPSGITTEQNTNTVWRIDSKDQTLFVEVEKHSLAIICTKYSHFDEFKESIGTVQKLFFQTFDTIGDIQRLGLRYINQLSIAGEAKVKWEEYVSSNLVGHLDFSEDTKIRRSMHSMVLAHDEDTQINFNFGVFNKYFPAPIIENEFIIDIDAFTTVAIKKEQILPTATKFNEVITEYFEKSITDKLRIKMEVQNG